MPTAIIIGVMAVVLGGITGTVLRDKLSETLKQHIPLGVCAVLLLNPHFINLSMA